MLKISTFLLLVASVSCRDRYNVTKKHSIEKRMIDSEYTNIKDVPYIVQIIGTSGYEKKTICGGSIISSQWIVTAAHCVTAGYVIDTVLTGNARAKRGSKHAVEKIIPHKGYDEDTSDNDIALIKVAKPIAFSPKQHAVKIAKLPVKSGDRLKVSGFGLIGNKFNLNFMRDMSSRSVKTGEITVISQQDCEAIYKGDSKITSNMFCAGREGDDSCSGDSGGPAVINGELIGIVTGGNECGSSSWSGVYTRLHPYFNWISDLTGLDLPASF